MVRRFAGSGAQLEQGADILLAEGPAAALQLAARTTQVLVEVASGVATGARHILLAARQGRSDIAVACTRQHLPGAKDVMLKAVLAAGCTPHPSACPRASWSSPSTAPSSAACRRANGSPGCARRSRSAAIVVEAGSVDEAVLFANSGADCVQLDHMAPEQVAEAVRAIAALDRRLPIAATGGIHAGNAAAYAAAGADVLVTSAPYAAPPIDVKVVMAEGVPAGRDHVSLIATAGRSTFGAGGVAGLDPLIGVVALGAAAGGFVQGLSGFAFGLVALSVWAWALDPVLAGPLTVFGSLVGQLLSAGTIRRVSSRGGRCPSSPAGCWACRSASRCCSGSTRWPSAWRSGCCWWSGAPRCCWRATCRGWRVAAGWRMRRRGWLGGVMGGLGGLTGPAPTLWVTLRGWGRDAQRAVFQSFNLAMHALTMAAYLASGTFPAEAWGLCLVVGPRCCCRLLGARCIGGSRQGVPPGGAGAAGGLGRGAAGNLGAEALVGGRANALALRRIASHVRAPTRP